MQGPKAFGSTQHLASFTSPKMRWTGLYAIPLIGFSGSDSIPLMDFRGRLRVYIHTQRRSREPTGEYGSRRQEVSLGSILSTFLEMGCRRPFRSPQYLQMVRVICDWPICTSPHTPRTFKSTTAH